MAIFKATVFIRLRSQVDDSPGNAVRDACKRMSKLYVNMSEVLVRISREGKNTRQGSFFG